ELVTSTKTIIRRNPVYRGRVLNMPGSKALGSMLGLAFNGAIYMPDQILNLHSSPRLFQWTHTDSTNSTSRHSTFSCVLASSFRHQLLNQPSNHSSNHSSNQSSNQPLY